MERVLFATNPSRRCGVYEFGRSTWTALKCSTRYEYHYLEFDESITGSQFCNSVEQVNPVAIVHNWHPATMPWLSDEVLYQLHRRQPAIRHAAIVHDVPAPFHWIDALVFNDPMHEPQQGEFCVGRRLWNRPEPTEDVGPVIGSFGFGMGGKGFLRIVQQVNQEFDTATIRLHIPSSEYCDQNGDQARLIIEECRNLAKPGIDIVVSSDYLSTDEMLDWLAGNAVNCFFYDDFKGRGISSVIDFALSARRPIAITPSAMFRHISEATPSILISRTSLKQIIANGLTPLQPFFDRWTDVELASSYDRAVDFARAQRVTDLTSNRVLTPRDRERLRPAIADLTELSPDIMARKFPEAVFQNAFIFEQARQLAKIGDRIILIGGYEDPIGPALERLGHDVTVTDPQMDGRESSDVLNDSLTSGVRYGMVISCSVIEHVNEDIDFIQSLYELLSPGGFALLTTDFCDGWSVGKPKPNPDVRLYTLERLRLLANALPDGSFWEPLNWKSVPPYFHYDGADYGFCSFAFRRPADDTADRFALRLLGKELKRRAAVQRLLRDENRNLHQEIDRLRSTSKAPQLKLLATLPDPVKSLELAAAKHITPKRTLKGEELYCSGYGETEKNVANLEDELYESKCQILALDDRVRRMKRTASWNLTAPLREFRRTLVHVSRWLTIASKKKSA